MTDYQRLVDEIRTFFQAADQVLTDGVKDLARKYAEACQEINNRLRRCDEYLKKGLRGEAIHFAQAEPVLLDEVAALDFPELPQFQEFLRANGLSEPPRLLLEIAQDLNRAYAEEQPLADDLLPRHRRLALLRAPLRERLQVMRQIAQIDKVNPVWADDIRVFESARLREIQAEMEGPAKGDAVRVEELAKELSQAAWLTPPSAALMEQVSKQAAILGRVRARSEIRKIVEELNEAMDRSDLPLGQTLSDRYHQLKVQGQLADNEPLAQRAARPLKWIAQREKAQQRELEVQTALAALEDALAQQKEPEVAAQLYDEALRLMPSLPARLEERYRTYIFQMGATRRWRENLILILVCIFGIISVVGLVGCLIVKNKSRQQASATFLSPFVSDSRAIVNYLPICWDHPGENRNG